MLDTVVGVAVNGVPLLSGVSREGVDPLYPAIYGDAKTLEDG